MLLAFPGWGRQSLLLILVYFVYVIKHPGRSSTSASRAGGRLGGAPGHHPEGVQPKAFLPSSAGEGRQELVPLLLCHPSFCPFAPLAENKNVRARRKELVSYIGTGTLSDWPDIYYAFYTEVGWKSCIRRDWGRTTSKDPVSWGWRILPNLTQVLAPQWV